MPHPEITPEQTASVDELLDWYLAEDPATYILNMEENRDFIQKILPILDRAVGETSGLQSHLEEPLFQVQISRINEKLNLYADDNTASNGLIFLAYCLSWKGIENGEDRYKLFLPNLNQNIRDIIESEVILMESNQSTCNVSTTITQNLRSKVKSETKGSLEDKARIIALKKFFLNLAKLDPQSAQILLNENDLALATEEPKPSITHSDKTHEIELVDFKHTANNNSNHNIRDIIDYRKYSSISGLWARFWGSETNTRTQLERYRGDQTKQTGHSI